MDFVRIAVVGCGGRGQYLLEGCVLQHEKARVVAVCDIYEDRCDNAEKWVTDAGQPAPFKTTDYHELLTREDVDAILISAAWEAHVPVAIDSMKAGKITALEVGGAYSIDDCWRLVRTWEETKTPFMFLENCCYGRREMMIMHMNEQGLLGRIVHCSGAYQHDLRKQIAYGKEKRHYRYANYISRNCENYPTHELGPIAQLLGINRGNRMLSLTATSSLSAGMQEYLRKNKPEDQTLLETHFNQGDVVTTVIKCANGETIRMMLCTTLPCFYSRQFTVHGTNAIYEESSDSLYMDIKEMHEVEWEWKKHWGNAEELAEKYDHPMWKNFLSDGVRGGHGGMDWLVIDDFLNCILENRPFPIDVYDAAAWMCITTISEDSIACGSMPQPIPDFTNGAWQGREKK